MTLENTGKETHQAQLARLKPGKTFADVQAALAGRDPTAILALLDFAGGPDAVPAGQRLTVQIDLTEGDYVMLCTIPSPDGVPHVAKGMVRPFRVAGTAAAPAASPTVDARVTLRDFSFTIPSDVRSGSQTWEVVNEGPQPHQFALLKIAPGKTVQDVLGALAPPSPGASPPAGPPPFQDVAGLATINAGTRGWITFDPEPGDYVALCFVLDPSSGKPHSQLGMVAPFTVK